MEHAEPVGQQARQGRRGPGSSTFSAARCPDAARSRWGRRAGLPPPCRPAALPLGKVLRPGCFEAVTSEPRRLHSGRRPKGNKIALRCPGVPGRRPSGGSVVRALAWRLATPRTIENCYYPTFPDQGHQAVRAERLRRADFPVSPRDPEPRSSVTDQAPAHGRNVACGQLTTRSSVAGNPAARRASPECRPARAEAIPRRGLHLPGGMCAICSYIRPGVLAPGRM